MSFAVTIFDDMRQHGVNASTGWPSRDMSLTADGHLAMAGAGEGKQRGFSKWALGEEKVRVCGLSG